MFRRQVAFDYLRTWLTVLVVAHHAVLAYVTFGSVDPVHYLRSTAPIVDATRWRGFDLFVAFNDSFFMSLMFLLSGLFVWPALRRKGVRVFLRDRGLRLGFPFVLAVTLVMPFAYYPSARVSGSSVGFLEYWSRSVTIGPWAAGPAWFIWVLLAFDGVAAGCFALLPNPGESSRTAPARVLSRSSTFFAALVGASLAGYLPMVLAFGSSAWTGLGPFAVQVSRVFLYGTYFGAGVALGAAGLENTFLSQSGLFAAQWPRWCALSATTFALFIGIQLADWDPPIVVARIVYGVVFVLTCAASSLAMTAGFLRFVARPVRVGDFLSEAAYGVYLLHYPVLVAIQYSLLGAPLSGLEKGVLVLTAGVVISWGFVWVLRQIPAIARVI